MKCRKCGEETFLPFQCPYCGDQFCTAHRLPETHDCPRMDAARTRRWEEAAAAVQEPASYEYRITYGTPRRAQGRIYFSQKELQHIGLGVLLVMGISLSFGFDYLGVADWAFVFSAIAAIITGSFLAHEIAHKVAAQRRGLWAEFRLTLWGAILTFISILLPFKIISPGAVMISGHTRIEAIGKISIAGPATNIALSTIFLGLTLAPTPYYWLFAVGAFFNGYIAVFNLIPVGLLDGYKIFIWNKKAWAAVFAVSVALAMMSYYIYYFY
ncbi:MAG: AN1-type zinc finger domain-containing protein [Candidatus Bathyarchaeales archaeon]